MIGLISINYKHAPVEIREQFDFSDNQKLDFYQILKSNCNVEGLMILSTCNRTEIYFEYENHIGQENKLMHAVLKALVDFKSFNESLSPYLEKKTNKDVVEHIFRVTSWFGVYDCRRISDCGTIKRCIQLCRKEKNARTNY